MNFDSEVFLIVLPCTQIFFLKNIIIYSNYANIDFKKRDSKGQLVGVSFE